MKTHCFHYQAAGLLATVGVVVVTKVIDFKHYFFSYNEYSIEKESGKVVTFVTR